MYTEREIEKEKGSNAKIEWESKKRKVISELTQSQLKKGGGRRNM